MCIRDRWTLSPALKWWQKPAAWHQWRLRRHVRKLDIDAATREIYLYLIAQLQDGAEGKVTDENAAKDQTPWIHWMAFDAGFWIDVHGGFTLQTYMHTPFLVLQQLYRSYQCNHPSYIRSSNGEVLQIDPDFINGSDRLVGAWRRRHAAAASELIRNQRERRN